MLSNTRVSNFNFYDETFQIKQITSLHLSYKVHYNFYACCSQDVIEDLISFGFVLIGSS